MLSRWLRVGADSTSLHVLEALHQRQWLRFLALSLRELLELLSTRLLVPGLALRLLRLGLALELVLRLLLSLCLGLLLELVVWQLILRLLGLDGSQR